MDGTTFFMESGCPAFLEAAIALYLVYSLGVNVKLTNEQTQLYPMQTFSGPYFLVIFIAIILHGLVPSSFSQHVSINGDLVYGSHASLYQSIFLITALFAVGISQEFLKNKNVLHFEYVILILFSILGLSVLSVSSNLAMIYLAIELQSLAFYVMATIG
jgi:NADH:ubiquinone oxidoreductase subunit 2 (subunit N)